MIKLMLTALAITCFATTALAWNQFGHMTVAAIAYEHLTPPVRQKVATLLKRNPHYDKWVEGVADQDKNRVAFIMASTWADAIKKDPAYTRDGTHNGNRPSGPNASRNIGYPDKLQHKYWHFVDQPFSTDGTALVDPPVPNAQTVIALFRETLKSPTATKSVKSYDLVWLLHLVADVHQPLHTISRFDAAHPDGDDGGNGVAVCSAPCNSTGKLHAFWDDTLGTSSDPKAAIRKAKALPAADPQLASVSDEATWIQESFHLAQAHAYTAPVDSGAGPFTLTDAYKTAAKEVAQQQIALAGIRLAHLLNDALQ